MAGANGSIGEQIVGFERLSGGGDPFGARRGAAFAALVNRQPQRVDQDLDLVAGGDVRRRGPRAERVLGQVIERGEAAREKLAVDDAFGKAVDGAKAELLGEPFDPLANQPPVARAERREPIAYDNPVGETAVDQTAL